MSWEVNRKKGNTAYESGDYFQAIQDLKLAQTEVESNGHSEQLLAGVLTELGKAQEKAASYEDAKVSLKKAISIYHHAQMAESIGTANALEALGRVHAEEANFSEAAKLINSAYALKKKLLPEPNPDVAESLQSLALLANRQRDNKQAAELWQQALDMRKTTLGEEHQDYGQSLSDLALIYSVTGRVNEAEPMLQKALKIKEKALGSEHPSLGYTLLALAGLYQNKKSFDAAEPYFKRATAIFEKKLGAKHSHTSITLGNFGGFYSAQGKLKEAITYYERALASKEQAFGKDNPVLVISLRNLAIAYRKLNQNQQADALDKRAVGILVKQTDDPNNRDTYVYVSLADVYAREGKFEEAQKVLEKGLEQTKRIYGSESLEVAKMLESLASKMSYKRLTLGAKELPKAIQQLKDLPSSIDQLKQKADQTNLEKKDGTQQSGLSEKDKKVNEQIKEYLTSSLRIKRNLFGNEHPEIAKTLNQLAECFAITRDFETSRLLREQAQAIELKTGDKSNTEHMLRKMLEEQRQKGDADNRKFLLSLRALAFHLERHNKEQEAEPLYDEYLQKLEKCLNQQPMELAQELVQLSLSYKDRGKNDKAVKLAKRAVDILEKSAQSDLPKLIRALKTLGICFEANNDFVGAEKVFKRILQLEEQQFGTHNWQLKNTLVYLSGLCKKSEHLEDSESYAERAKSLPEPTKEEKETQNKALQEELTQHLKDSMIKYLGEMAQQFGTKP